jgi:hypothetical protein
MTEEDEAFEDLAKRQGDWGMQGSRKHQIMRYAENVENKGTSMTQDEIIEMAKEARIHRDDSWRFEMLQEKNALEAFAKLVAEKATAKEREACARLVDHILKEGGGTWGDVIRARGQTCTPPQENT